ncbi:glycosyltransferase family 4 protein [Roseivirga seohaensis]|uniref:glycosyltransferase family 4 protein n=1 Tax=Roseivirga seohaensis TaxID=1914963 RepID=UPI0009ED0809|nr:glycosyltransferase family 4 protein [Roseivirga seohaensis]
MKPTKMNILLICKSLPWRFKGGIQTHTWNLALALTEKGHSVSVLTGGAYREAEKQYEIDGVSIIEIPFFPGRYLKPISNLAEEFSFNWQAKNWVKKNHSCFNVIHTQGRSGYLLYMIPALKGRLANTIHGIISRESSSEKGWSFNSKLHAWLTQKIEYKLLKAAHLKIAVSEDVCKEISLSNHLEGVEVIPNGVKLSTVEAITNQQVLVGDKTKFLFVGRLHPVKGLVPVITAIAKTKSKIQLDIVGNGPQYKTLKDLIKKHKLESQITLLGEFSNAQIHEAIPSYRALLLPSSYETQGIVLLEANAHGVPVVATDLAAIRESVSHGENGLLCNIEQPESYVYAMEYLLENPAEAERMGAIGKERISSVFTWDKVAERTIESYQKLAI